MGIHLETDRLIMRDWKEGDLPHFSRINSDPIIMEYYPSRLDEAASERLVDHFQEHIEKHGFGFFAVESKADGAFVGFAGLSYVPKKMPFAPAVELAWRLDYDFWGKGYATEAAKALIAYAFDELELEEVVAYCVEDNQRAHQVLGRLNFKCNKKENFNYAPRRQKDAVHAYNLYRLKHTS